MAKRNGASTIEIEGLTGRVWGVAKRGLDLLEFDGVAERLDFLLELRDAVNLDDDDGVGEKNPRAEEERQLVVAMDFVIRRYFRDTQAIGKKTKITQEEKIKKLKSLFQSYLSCDRLASIINDAQPVQRWQSFALCVQHASTTSQPETESAKITGSFRSVFENRVSPKNFSKTASAGWNHVSSAVPALSYKAIVLQMKNYYKVHGGSAAKADLIFGKDNQLKTNLMEIFVTLQARAKANPTRGFLCWNRAGASLETLNGFKKRFYECEVVVAELTKIYRAMLSADLPHKKMTAYTQLNQFVCNLAKKNDISLDAEALRKKLIPIIEGTKQNLTARERQHLSGIVEKITETSSETWNNALDSFKANEQANITAVMVASAEAMCPHLLSAATAKR